ncbi:MAG UNVERIFIED_CONTAM: cation transporter, partial [Thermobifida fusca]
HAWTITSGMPVLSAHVVVEDSALADSGRLLARLHDCLSTHFSIDHSTIQVEPVGHAHHENACRA